MLQIEGRDAVEGVVVVGIHLFLNAGGLIVGLGVRVTGQEGQRPRGSFDCCFEPVVL
jgi:hypothetical protein